MAKVKVFHLKDAPADGTNDVSRHVSINQLVNNYEFVGRAGMRVGTGDFHDYHPAEVFAEAIRRFTFGPGASDRFLRQEVRSLGPGDILLRSDTGEAVILTQDGYEVLDLSGVKGRTDLDSEGTPTDDVTFPGYDPGSNESFDAEEHTYDEEEEMEGEDTTGLAELFE